jgi:predicted transcriptional regulator YdeE
MKTAEQYVEAFRVAGVEARTSNTREMSGQGVIGPLWRRLEKPSGKMVIAVYCDYQGNRDGEYTYVLGVKASEGKRQVAAGSYAVLTFKGAVTPEAVVDLWKQIWALEDAHAIRRSYRTDFEAHGENHLEVYVGVES